MSRPLVITPSEVAPRWRVSEEVAEQFLRDFDAAGFVSKVGDSWTTTEAGLVVSEALCLLAPEEIADHSRPARRRRTARA